ncbi:MAG TPA: tryptophan--tRNA ligase [Actinomycetota bacterium]|nr:tryptophan--tRNA ligase [Actinomycetota bacterium]
MGRRARAIIGRIDQVTENPTGAGTGPRRARVLTGYRPTGPLHLGHWFGNIQNMLRLQLEHEAFFFVADWHALTTDFDRTENLPGNVRGLILDWLAAGIDPEVATVYRQSDLPEVAEMTLLIGMIVPLGWLERVPTFKERLRDLSEREIANYGLLGYPVLQTVDITIVRGELVPVGEDQLPHLELSREIVRRFNKLYGPVLVEPKALLSESPQIPGIDGRKMSSSLGNDIRLRDDPDTVRKKVRRMVTDPQKVRLGDPGRPEICPVFALHRRFSEDILDETAAGCRAGTLPCVQCKENLADRLIPALGPYREARERLETTPGVAGEVLADGAKRVRPVVEETIDAVRTAMRMKGLGE